MIRGRGERDYGSVLLGSASDGPTKRRIRIQTILTGSIVLSNFVGAVVTISLSSVGIPEPSTFAPEMWWINYIAVPIYVALAFVIGIGWGTYTITRDLRWAIRRQPPTAADARRTRRVAGRLLRLQAALWLGAVVMFTIMYGIQSPMLIPKMFFVIGLSGAVVVGVTYLLIELALRPVSADLISAGYRRRKRSGVLSRAVVAWIVGSATPIVGILLLVSFGAFRQDTSKLDLFVGVFVLAVISLGTGLLLTWLTTTSVTGPLRSVRNGMNKVQAGNVDVDLVVYDGTELGDLQVGFNSMVSGLRERERMRDLFGRHVGREVAEAALSSDPALGGTERTVAALFVDVIGSTTLAAERSPTEVVEILNRFFAVIVRAVEQQRGLVNKFEGDAVLAIFGAPIDLDDAAGAALCTAREIARELERRVPELSAGIGVGFGPAVAGNVGAIERFEYTIIGDPVNESARLSELAKRDPRRPLASGRTVDVANPQEAAHWEEQETTSLRGRTEETRVYAAVVDD